jgi:hypothetical protein
MVIVGRTIDRHDEFDCDDRQQRWLLALCLEDEIIEYDCEKTNSFLSQRHRGTKRGTRRKKPGASARRLIEERQPGASARRLIPDT